jgi:hypothetical protein
MGNKLYIYMKKKLIWMKKEIISCIFEDVELSLHFKVKIN